MVTRELKWRLLLGTTSGKAQVDPESERTDAEVAARSLLIIPGINGWF